jgi:hypothetical protein
MGVHALRVASSGTVAYDSLINGKEPGHFLVANAMHVSASADGDVKASAIATQAGRSIVQFLCPAQTGTYSQAPKFRAAVRRKPTR